MGVICHSSDKSKDKKTQSEKIIEAKNTKPKEEKNEKEEVKSEEKKEENNKKEKSPESNLSTKPSQKETKNSTLITKNQQDKKNVVSIDSNVFVVKGETSPDLFYIREKTLGHGSYGTVYLVKHKQLHRYFAMKVIKKSHKNKSEEDSLMNEINILRKMDHPNILKMTDFYNQKKRI